MFEWKKEKSNAPEVELSSDEKLIESLRVLLRHTERRANINHNLNMTYLHEVQILNKTVRRRNLQLKRARLKIKELYDQIEGKKE